MDQDFLWFYKNQTSSSIKGKDEWNFYNEDNEDIEIAYQIF